MEDREVNAQLGHAKNSQTLRNTQFATRGSKQQQTPQANAFADMLSESFVGNPNRPCRPPSLTENPWTLHDLHCAVRRLKIHKGADEASLVAELLLQMLANKAGVQQPPAFRPIGNIVYLQKTFAFMVLALIKAL